MAKTVLIPLPDRDFDVTEVAVPWRELTRAGHTVLFATEEGATPAADPLLLRGVLFGQLGAKPEPVRYYRELENDPRFRAPMKWRDIDAGAVDGLFLPGGHAPGMRQYLAGKVLHEKVAAIWERAVPVGAICHGVLVLARAKDDAERPLLHARRTTCLPKYMERTAWMITAWKLGDYYRTYPEYVEDEVRRALASPSQFERGPLNLVAQGTATDERAAFVVEDGNYVSARWPGDAYLVAKRFLARL